MAGFDHEKLDKIYNKAMGTYTIGAGNIETVVGLITDQVSQEVENQVRERIKSWVNAIAEASQ